MKTVLVTGATGAQGSAVVKDFSASRKYKVLALTRSDSSPSATELAALPNVELVISKAASGYDTEAFLSAASTADYVFLNTDGFALGEQAETYWGTRLFELAVKAGVKHVVYSGLDNSYKKSGFDPKYYVGHYAGKARVQEWMHAQKDFKMNWTIIRSGPYLELLSAVMAPSKDDEGNLYFTIPLGKGEVPFIYLSDFPKYVDWALSNPEESNHLDYGIATAHISGSHIAEAISAHTGKQAKYIDIPIQVWNGVAWKELPNGPDTKIGFQHIKDNNALLMSYGENFENWWNLYKASAGNTGLITRDYAFLDNIVPDRVKSIEEWLKKVKYTGDRKGVLRNQEHTKH